MRGNDKRNIRALQRFLTDEQILEVMIRFETRKIDACKMFQEMMFDKWQMSVLEAMGILQNIQKEL